MTLMVVQERDSIMFVSAEQDEELEAGRETNGRL